MAGKLIRYTFAVCYAGCEECEYITYGIPEDVDDPQIYFVNKTGETVHTYWRSDHEAIQERVNWLRKLHERRMASETV